MRGLYINAFRNISMGVNIKAPHNPISSKNLIIGGVICVDKTFIIVIVFAAIFIIGGSVLKYIANKTNNQEKENNELKKK